MKKNCILFLSLTISLTSVAQIITPECEQRAEKLVNQMTLNEKMDLIGGYNSFFIKGIPHLGIPEIFMADGPQGIRNNTKFSTLYPCGILTASTWNKQLVHRLGERLGNDARARGVNFLLGPGVNIYRSPMCGRNFEYFGEDPYLTSEVAKEYILGVQSKGVIATIKHFAANNQEWNRTGSSSEIDERTLQEIYLPAFRKAVEEAHVGAIMDSYNLVNGKHSTENEWLNIHILRDTWGFKGVLMSDWDAIHSTLGAVNYGPDIEMPYGLWMNYEKIKPYMDRGMISENTIDLKVQHILQTLIAFRQLDRVQKDSSIALDNAQSKQTALDIAREGAVMLKNDAMLPLKGKTAILGLNADTIVCGGGSGEVHPISYVTMTQAMRSVMPGVKFIDQNVMYDDITSQLYADSLFKNRGFSARYYSNKDQRGEPAVVKYDSRIWFDWGFGKPLPELPADYFSANWTSYYKADVTGRLGLHIGGDDGYRVFVNGKLITGDWGEHSYTDRMSVINVEAGKTYKFYIEFFDNKQGAYMKFSLSRYNANNLRKALYGIDNVVYCTGFNKSTEGEGFDRSFEMPGEQDVLIHNLASIGKKVVTVINSGGGVEMNSWLADSKAVLMSWYPGQNGSTAIAEILVGKINPSGKLPISIERKWEDNPCHDSYYKNMQGREYPCTEYTEGIFCGYRGYDKSDIKPLFPFGFGLSYTKFQYSNIKLIKNNSDVIVSLQVKNTGKYEGKEVVQVYVHQQKCSAPRPVKELKGYDKVSLKRGETKTVTITLPKSSFEFYDINSKKFIVEPGFFDILVGASSTDIRLQKTIDY